MVYRITGIVLILISCGAVVAHDFELALPTLDWFFSFESKEKELVESTVWQRNREEITGHILCGILLAVGVIFLRMKSREVKWNPQTVRKLKRFKSITRGYVSSGFSQHFFFSPFWIMRWWGRKLSW